jgi:hypothetical protein
MLSNIVIANDGGKISGWAEKLYANKNNQYRQ